MSSSSPYTLIYHAGIPGRGEFIRLYFEATGTSYNDEARTVGQQCITPYLKGTFEDWGKNPTPFAPPCLRNGDLVISQTPNILLYLSARLPPIDLEMEDSDEPKTKKSKQQGATSLEDPSTFHINELVLTVLDCNNEVHDTHHPIDVQETYEKQKDAARLRAKAFRELRLPAYLSHFEKNIAKWGSVFLLGEGVTYADLALFHLVDGLHYAFPQLMETVGPTYPLVMALHRRIKTSPRIADYLKSERRMPWGMGIFRHYPELDEA